jgi:hypothetical protein
MMPTMTPEWGEVARTLPDCSGGNVDAWDMLGRIVVNNQINQV